MTSSSHESKFPIPFTLEQFRQDILEVSLHYMRVQKFVTGDSAHEVVRAYGIDPSTVNLDQFNPVDDAQASAGQIGLDYQDVKDMLLAQTLERMYEFAYEGRIDSGFASMEDESCFTFVSALLVDADQSMLSHEWSLRGSNADAAIFRCRQVADLANARNILEGGESFFHYLAPSNNKDTFSGLTIRQMALLAAMEEMSVRAAANPKRANPLKTTSEGKSTFVLVSDAKEWLQSKALYVPVTFHFRDAFFDMRKRGFKDRFEMKAMLIARFDALTDERGAPPDFPGDLASQFSKRHISTDIVSNSELLDQIALGLALPGTLLKLRAQQLLATERMDEIEFLIQEQTAQD